MSTATPETTISEHLEPFTFLPPAGGDICLKSSDRVTFSVHSILLSLPSAVFAGMLANATKADTIELAEDAETIALMLAFIYPAPLPSITSLELLEKAMLVAHKYNVQRIAAFIEHIFRPDNPLLKLDPVGVFGVSARYGFAEVRVTAARSLRSARSGLMSVAGLTRLARMLPDASHVIGLVGAQWLRTRVLDEVPLDHALEYNIYPLYEPTHSRHTSSSSAYMACPDCWRHRRLMFEGRYHYIPGWFHTWSSRLRTELLETPLNQCGSYFNVDCIAVFQDTEFEACGLCVESTLAKRAMFNEWGKASKRVIEDELKVLDVLYSL